IAGIVFLILNPAWWPSPLQMPGIVLSLRGNMLSTQITFYATPTFAERLTALVRYPFGPPQYFEDSMFDWTQWIGPDIAAYEASGTAGLRGSNLTVALQTLLLILGSVYCIWQCWRRRESKMLLLLVTTAFIAASVFVLNILPWAR